MKKNHLLSLLLAVCLALTLCPAARGEEASPPPEVMPNYFALIDTVDIYGQPFDASQFTQGLVFFNIWATWCGPCVNELPALSAIARAYEGRVRFVGLCIDTVTQSGEDILADEAALAGARALWEKNDMPFPAIMPDNLCLALLSVMEVQGIPTTWFVDDEGLIIAQLVGANTEEGWREAIDQVLAYADAQE